MEKLLNQLTTAAIHLGFLKAAYQTRNTKANEEIRRQEKNVETLKEAILTMWAQRARGWIYNPQKRQREI